MDSEGPPPVGYRPNVGVCLVNSHNQVLVVSRLNVPGAWQMPQGGIEEGEDPKVAAMRELRQETGIVCADFVAELPYWLTYDFPPSVKAKVNRVWGGGSQWHGHAHKWFLMRLTSQTHHLHLPEFSASRWAHPHDVVQQAVDYKRPTYAQVITHFQPYLTPQQSPKSKSTKW